MLKLRHIRSFTALPAILNLENNPTTLPTRQIPALKKKQFNNKLNFGSVALQLKFSEQKPDKVVYR